MTEKLSELEIHLINDAHKTLGGDPEEVYDYIFEKLQIGRGNTVRDFIFWAHASGVPTGSAVIEDWFEIFQLANGQPLPYEVALKYWKQICDKHDNIWDDWSWWLIKDRSAEALPDDILEKLESWGTKVESNDPEVIAFANGNAPLSIALSFISWCNFRKEYNPRKATFLAWVGYQENLPAGLTEEKLDIVWDKVNTAQRLKANA